MIIKPNLCAVILLICLAMITRESNAQEKSPPKITIAAVKEIVESYDKKLRDLTDLKIAAVKRIKRTFVDECDEIRDELVGSLKTHLDSQTKDGNLDNALELRNLIEYYEQLDPIVENESEKQIRELTEKVAKLESQLTGADHENIKDAEVEITKGTTSVLPLKIGNKPFSNRDYTWSFVPAEFPFARYGQLEGGGNDRIYIKVKETGWVYVGVQAHELEDSKDFLQNQGWELTTQTLGIGSKRNTRYLMHLYRKKLPQGVSSMPRNSFGGPMVFIK